MFTGIIEEIGQITGFKKLIHGADLKIKCKKVLEGTKLGDSISINGMCTTVVELSEESFSVNISDESLKVTSFNSLNIKDLVNLERALRLSDRLSGHIVSGHVDGTSNFLGKENLGEFYNMKFEIPENQKKYIVKKGSITVNGISLTVADITGDVFMSAVIPHTFENTTLKQLKNGDKVNLETDILAKYVENFVITDDKKPITKGFLEENGFM